MNFKDFISYGQIMLFGHTFDIIITIFKTTIVKVRHLFIAKPNTDQNIMNEMK